MRFDIYGGAEARIYTEEHGIIPKKPQKHKAFWEDIEERCANGLPDACGCYVFAIKSGGGITPWYVGKAEKSPFKKECFGAHQINCYNDALARYEIGTPILFFVTLLTTGGQFANPRKSGDRSIAFLERWLIGQALNKNPNLINIKDTRFLKKLVVYGLLKSPPGKPTAPQKELRGLEKITFPLSRSIFRRL